MVRRGAEDNAESRPTLTGFENRIREYADAHLIPIGRRQVKRMARDIASRAADPDHEISVEDYFRIAYADPTGEDAVRNITRASSPAVGAGSFHAPRGGHRAEHLR